MPFPHMHTSHHIHTAGSRDSVAMGGDGAPTSPSRFRSKLCPVPSSPRQMPAALAVPRPLLPSGLHALRFTTYVIFSASEEQLH